MFAVDDGISSGNLNAADIFFLLGVIFGFIAALLTAAAATPRTPASRVPSYASVFGWAAVGCIAFGFLLL